MEIAEQWQREWTGAAEYGKVTEGGVTRRIARAMEVLNASKPGARVRVMRAAYHSTAGPGVPASSYMLHSSRRVISSGFNYTEPPSLPSLPVQPLEISSTPLDSSTDFNLETENYKVTEPDDSHISEPSKWKSLSTLSALRMPSEESSSTDNASIIDLDSKTDHNLSRKYSYDSENSDIQWNKGSNKVSHIINAPVTLNTLKYTSLLNSNNDWHNRRKSYSFEDTAPSKESMVCGNNTIAIESSTDSGICKSSEIVDDHIDNNNILHQEQKNIELKDETFQDWLSKNRNNSFYNGTKFKTEMEHNIVIEEPNHNNITLQSAGKMTISLPITIERNSNFENKKNQTYDETQRKVKKVEFCKTELHFAPDTGKVNIIATDEKPPPSNDFRKRRSIFLPLHDMPEKPITLFGEKNNETTNYSRIETTINHSNNEINESDENTAATKSILKNKIPKPKPYLLGENMAFGSPNDLSGGDRLKNDTPALTAVSLINKQLQSQRRYSDEVQPSLTKDIEIVIHESKHIRTNKIGPTKDASFKSSDFVTTNKTQQPIKSMDNLTHVQNIKKSFEDVHRTPIQRRPKTRELRESDLTYFGYDNNGKHNKNLKTTDYNSLSDDSAAENIFQSVKLIQKISSSVCSSETELDDVPEYQNIPIQIENAPIPAPRLHSKYDEKRSGVKEVCSLMPIVEQEYDKNINIPTTRRSRFRRQEEDIVSSNRSVSEPPKRYQFNSLEMIHGKQIQSVRCMKSNQNEENVNHKELNQINKTKKENKTNNLLEPIIPVYVNLTDNKIVETPYRNKSSPQRPQLQRKASDKRNNSKHYNKDLYSSETDKKMNRTDFASDSLKKKQRSHYKQPEKVETVIKTRNNQRNIDHHLSGSSNSNKSITNKTNKRSEHKITDRNAFENKHMMQQSTYSTPGDILKKDEYKTEDIKQRKSSQIKKNSDVDNKIRSPKENTDVKEFKLSNVQFNKKNNMHISNSPQLRLNNDNMKNKEPIAKLENHRTSRKSKYIINYDDKNGTVSSVCKIKQGPAGTSLKQKLSKEFLEENTKELPFKSKALNKIALRK